MTSTPVLSVTRSQPTTRKPTEETADHPRRCDILKPAYDKYEPFDHREAVDTLAYRMKELKRMSKDIPLADLQARQLFLKARWNSLKVPLVAHNAEAAQRTFLETVKTDPRQFLQSEVYDKVRNGLEPWEHLQMAKIHNQFTIQREMMDRVYRGMVWWKGQSYDVGPLFSFDHDSITNFCRSQTTKYASKRSWTTSPKATRISPSFAG